MPVENEIKTLTCHICKKDFTIRLKGLTGIHARGRKTSKCIQCRLRVTLRPDLENIGWEYTTKVTFVD